MPGEDVAKDLVASRWIHIFEEDSPNREVYRPASGGLPLSRRPREQIEFFRDGTARILKAGADDRMVPVEATWAEEGGSVVVRSGGKGAESARVLRIAEISPGRLVIGR
jgi:hypothetical protein